MPPIPRPLNPTQRLSSMRQAATVRQLASAHIGRTAPQVPPMPMQYAPPPPHPPAGYQHDPAAMMESDPVIIEARNAMEYSERRLAHYQQAYTRSQAGNNQANTSKSAKRIQKHRNEINATTGHLHFQHRSCKASLRSLTPRLELSLTPGTRR
jgi:hypothetical protein